MNKQDKNGSKGLILLLLAMVLFVVYQVFIVPLINKEETKMTEPTKEDEVTLEEIGEELYSKTTLSPVEEYGIPAEDEALLSGKLTIYKMSDKLKINLAIKNIKDKSVVVDSGYSIKDAAENMDGNYYYIGKYIPADAVQESINSLCGPTPIKHQKIELRDIKYVYNEVSNVYEIWTPRKTPEYTEEKVTYKEVVAKDEEILVYEYVAYTDYKDLDNIKTRTVHSKRVEVVISEDNVEDYLSYMDKYKYTYKKNKDGNYYFVSVEYVYE